MFCNKMRNQLKSLLSEFDSFVDNHIDVALKVTTAIKNALASPVADIITALIPGEIDNALRIQLLNALGKVVEALTIVEECKKYDNLNEKLACFIAQLKERNPELQDAILQKIASLLAFHLDGQRLKQNLYDLYTQAKYTSLK